MKRYFNTNTEIESFHLLNYLIYKKIWLTISINLFVEPGWHFYWINQIFFYCNKKYNYSIQRQMSLTFKIPHGCLAKSYTNQVLISYDYINRIKKEILIQKFFSEWSHRAWNTRCTDHFEIWKEVHRRLNRS